MPRKKLLWVVRNYNFVYDFHKLLDKKFTRDRRINVQRVGLTPFRGFPDEDLDSSSPLEENGADEYVNAVKDNYDGIVFCLDERANGIILKQKQVKGHKFKDKNMLELADLGNMNYNSEVHLNLGVLLGKLEVLTKEKKVPSIGFIIGGPYRSINTLTDFLKNDLGIKETQEVNGDFDMRDVQIYNGTMDYFIGNENTSSKQMSDITNVSIDYFIGKK